MISASCRVMGGNEQGNTFPDEDNKDIGHERVTLRKRKDEGACQVDDGGNATDGCPDKFSSTYECGGDDEKLEDPLYNEKFRGCEFGTLAEQRNESSFDDRSDADDDCTKGHLKITSKLYGRDKELSKLRSIFDDCCQGKSQSVFLGGYSGTGKSALVTEFAKQLVHEDNNPASESNRIMLVAGKCSSLKSSAPFDAISNAMAQLVGQVLALDEAKLRLTAEKLAKAGIDERSDDARTLVEMMPQLAPLLWRGTERASIKSARVGTCQDLTYFKVLFSKFLRSIYTKQQPILMFIDDLQWASAASLDLISALCSDTSLQYLVFIGSYRLNEVDNEHPVFKVMTEVENASGGNLHKLELSNLSPGQIAQFIADLVGRSDNVDEVRTIVDVVYRKTLGNVFFVIQALEELVRSNALYYDVMTFQWEWGDVGRVDLEKYLSNDVLEMIRSKISRLPLELQKALTLIAFTSNKIDTETLRVLLEGEGLPLSIGALTRLLDRAVAEGVLLETLGTAREYQFSHDQIQEAASTLVPPGKGRNELLVRISHVLAERGMKHSNDNWMLFVAVHHLNSVPKDFLVDRNKVARLNYHVSMLATRKASFPLACSLARIGVGYLDKITSWKHHYELCLDLYNLLARIEHALGNFNEALVAVDQVLENATSKEDQSSAHETRAGVIFNKNNHNHKVVMETFLKTLKVYGVHLPFEPSIGDVLFEQLRMRAALGNKPLSVLTELPVTQDDSAMKLLQWVSLSAIGNQHGRMVVFVSLRAVRLALKQGAVTKYHPLMVTTLGLPLRMREKYEQACACGDTAVSLLARFPDADRSQIALTRLILTATILLLRRPFRASIEDFLEFHWILISHGKALMGLIAAQQAAFCFFAASLPLNFMLEPMLQSFQNVATDMGRNEFLSSFKCMQQFARNLQVKSAQSATLFGEEALLGALKGNAKKMLQGEVIQWRLQLAFIFDDEAVMEGMLEALREYRGFEAAIARQHLRLAFAGLAGLTLARRKGSETKKKKNHVSWGLMALNRFKKLDRFGSPNASAILRCLEAVQEPSKDAFDKAILACSEDNLINLAAMMNERCANFLAEQGQVCSWLAKEYLTKALWLYTDWGAAAKVAKLKEQYDFLRQATRNEPPLMLHTLLRSSNLKGFNSPLQ